MINKIKKYLFTKRAQKALKHLRRERKTAAERVKLANYLIAEEKDIDELKNKLHELFKEAVKTYNRTPEKSAAGIGQVADKTEETPSVSNYSPNARYSSLKGVASQNSSGSREQMQ